MIKIEKINETKVIASGTKGRKSVRLNLPAVIRDTLEIKPGDTVIIESYLNKGKKLAILKKDE